MHPGLATLALDKCILLFHQYFEWNREDFLAENFFFLAKEMELSSVANELISEMTPPLSSHGIYVVNFSVPPLLDL